MGPSTLCCAPSAPSALFSVGELVRYQPFVVRCQCHWPYFQWEIWSANGADGFKILSAVGAMDMRFGANGHSQQRQQRPNSFCWRPKFWEPTAPAGSILWGRQPSVVHRQRHRPYFQWENWSANGADGYEVRRRPSPRFCHLNVAGQPIFTAIE